MRVHYVKDKVSVDVVRITTVDERWYYLFERYFPSSTWISSYVRKSEHFIRWFATHGFDKAQEIRQAAGNKGSKVHQAIHDYVQGKEIPMDAQYMNNDSGILEELTVEEFDCIVSFHDWWMENKPTLIKTEEVVLNTAVGYAGTLDLVVSIKGQLYLIDIKTSKDIYIEHELQLSSYLHCMENPADYIPAILQVGYGRNKKGFKFTELEDKFELFLSARNFWLDDNPDAKPFQKDYPVMVSRAIAEGKAEPPPSVPPEAAAEAAPPKKTRKVKPEIELALGAVAPPPDEWERAKGLEVSDGPK